MTENACPGECSIVNMDHQKGFGADAKQMVNRMCRSCKLHWYGEKNVDVGKFTQEEWDVWVNEA